jgi:hypothetical protein
MVAAARVNGAIAEGDATVAVASRAGVGMRRWVGPPAAPPAGARRLAASSRGARKLSAR